ncbi:MAG: hypothetical protein J1E62_07695 [Lachnospiraceae bacterium]|nr:hypothetical protein [Lachnospiraceae bacterium]
MRNKRKISFFMAVVLFSSSCSISGTYPLHSKASTTAEYTQTAATTGETADKTKSDITVKYTENNQSRHYFYNQLEDGAKVLYEAMYTMYTEGILKTGTEDYDLASNGYVTQEQLQSYANGNTKLLSDFGAARDAFYADYPDIFYVDFSYFSIRITKDASDNFHAYLGTGRSDNYYVQGFASKKQVEDAIAEYENKLNEIVTEAQNLSVEDGDNLIAQQVKYIHDTIIRNTSYRLENTCKKENIGHVRTVYGTLVKGESVCEGYSRAMKSVLDRLDIPCVLVQGVYRSSENKSELHMWNYVKVDDSDKWYAVDSTMDDPISRTAGDNGLDGYESSEYLLVGKDIMSQRHVPSGIMSAVNYEFTYPELAMTSCMFERIYNDNGLTVIYNKDGTFEDIDAGIFKISYDGMGYAKAAETGKYLLGRFHQYYEATDEWKYGDWGYLLPDVFSAFEDTDTEITIPVPHCLYVEFAVTDIAPGDYLKDPEKTGFQGDQLLLQAETGMIYNPNGNYVAPPYIKSVTPAVTCRINANTTYHVKAVYDDILQLKDEAAEAGYEIIVTDPGTTAKEYCEISNFNWDGESTIEFDFTPSKMWADDSIFYQFHITGLVGRKSLKTPNPITYFASTPGSYCALRANGYNWNVFGKPALLENSDLSTIDWTTRDGETITGDMLNRLILVAESTTNAQTDEMNELITDSLSEKNKLIKSETYNINLTICKCMVIKTGEAVRVCLGFPAGYGPNDAGVTFKAYHFDKNDAGEITGMQEIPCIITQYGLLVLCDSFSPFAIAVVKDEGRQAAVKEKTIILSNTLGGNITGADSVFTLSEKQSKSLTISANKDYEIDELVVGGQMSTITDKNTMTVKINYEDMADGINIVDVKFAAKSVHKKEQERGEELVHPAAIPAVIKMSSTSMTVQEKQTLSIKPDIVEHEGTHTYQWYKDGVLLSGQRGKTLTIASATKENAGSYTLAVTNSVDSVSTRAISAVCKVSVVSPTNTNSFSSSTVSKLKAVSDTVNKVKLTWKKTPGAKGYYVYRYNSKKAKYVKLAESTKLTYTDKTCTSGKAYRYRVAAYKSENGKRTLSKKSDVVKIIVKPRASKKVSGKRTGSTKIELSVKKVSGATAYQIYQYDKATKKYLPAYKAKGKKLYWYQKKTKKWKYLRKLKSTKSGKIVFVLKDMNAKTAYKFRITTLVSKSGYKTAESKMSKVVKVTYK